MGWSVALEDDEYHCQKVRIANQIASLQRRFTLESWQALLEAAEEIYEEQVAEMARAASRRV